MRAQAEGSQSLSWGLVLELRAAGGGITSELELKEGRCTGQGTNLDLYS